MLDSFYGSLPRKPLSLLAIGLPAPRVAPLASLPRMARLPTLASAPHVVRPPKVARLTRIPHLASVARLTLLAGLLVLLGACLLAPAAASASGDLAGLQSDLSHQLALAGPADGAYVYDLTTHQALFSERASTLRPPASVEKLYTATTALERMGPTARLSTTVYGVGRLAPGGVWEGNLYLRGGGDPTFGSSAFIRSHYDGIGASVSSLVTELVHTDGIHRITGSVYGDESYFDSLRGEPSSDYATRPVPRRNALGARVQPRRDRARRACSPRTRPPPTPPTSCWRT